MTSWGRLESTVHDHWKFKRLAQELGITHVQAVGHCTILWAWAHEHAPDGDLADLELAEVEEVAKWQGVPGAFVAAMCSARVRLLDKHGERYVIHDFYERAAQRKEAQRKADQRALNKRKDAPTVYVIDGGDRVKIGYSANLTRRMSEYVKGEQRLVATLDGDEELERALHRRFAESRIGKSEWFMKTLELEAWVRTLVSSVSWDSLGHVQVSVPEDKTGHEKEKQQQHTPKPKGLESAHTAVLRTLGLNP